MDADARAVRRAAAGDAEVLEALLRRWMGAVYGHAWRVLDDPEQAADICQEVMLAVIRGLPSLQQPRCFPAWLRRITERQIARHERRPPTMDLPEPATEPSAESIVLEHAEAQRLRALVRSAVAALPARSRLAVELFYYRGLSCRQVAEFLGSTRGAVKVLLHQARREMREMIDEDAQPTPAPEPRIGRAFLSGSEVERAPLHDRGGPGARLFCALYPRGTLAAAAARAGLSNVEAETLLEQLLATSFVACDNGAVRCLVPLLLPTDWELLKPWLRQAADATMPLLEPIRGAAERLAECGRDEAEQAMLRQIMTVPLGTYSLFRALVHGFREVRPERGPSGRYLWAAVDASVSDYRGGWHGGFSDHGDEKRWSVIAAPAGMDYGRRHELELGPPESAPFGCHIIPDALLWGLVDGPLDGGRLEALTAHTRGLSAVGLRQVLLDCHLVVETAEGLRHNLPVLPRAAYREHEQTLAALARRLLELLPDLIEDLRARIAETSFRDTGYTDATFLCAQLLKDEVDHRLLASGPPFEPERLPPNWGIVLSG